VKEPVDTTQHPPVDTIPDNPPPVDTIPDNPPPVDTIPDNPPPVDTIPDNPPPVDTIPDNPPPVDTIPDNPPPVDSIPDVVTDVKAYPNPFRNELQLRFNNTSATGQISVDMFDTYGRLIFRQNFGTRPTGNNILVIHGFSTNLRIGMYLLAMKVDGEKLKTLKVIKSGY
jgi:hypothetical protein